VRIATGIALVLALAGCTGKSVHFRIAPDGYLVRHVRDWGGEPNCRDFALLRSAELTLENGYRYFTASTPPTLRPEEALCEVHIRMFHERPECEYAVFYDATVTKASLEAVLQR
jgi:hypothetical protein